MSEERRIHIEFGALVKPLAEQLSEQHVGFDPEAIERFQADCTAISRCFFDDLITYSIKERAQKKLSDKVFGHLKAYAMLRASLAALQPKDNDHG